MERELLDGFMPRRSTASIQPSSAFHIDHSAKRPRRWSRRLSMISRIKQAVAPTK